MQIKCGIDIIEIDRIKEAIETTKEEFIKIYPDYKIFMSLELGTQVNSEYPSEIQLAYNKSEEIFKKYVEKFISELSE